MNGAHQQSYAARWRKREERDYLLQGARMPTAAQTKRLADITSASRGLEVLSIYRMTAARVRGEKRASAAAVS
jgi:hypothetical protein